MSLEELLRYRELYSQENSLANKAVKLLCRFKTVSRVDDVALTVSLVQ